MLSGINAGFSTKKNVLTTIRYHILLFLSDPILPYHWVTGLLNFVQIVGFVKVFTLTLLNGFLKIDTWIYLRSYMDLSKLLHGFLKVVNMHLSKLFYVFLALCWTKLSWSLTKISEVLLWNRFVEWVKVLNAVGPLCLWQCLSFVGGFVLFSWNGRRLKVGFTASHDGTAYGLSKSFLVFHLLFQVFIFLTFVCISAYCQPWRYSLRPFLLFLFNFSIFYTFIFHL